MKVLIVDDNESIREILRMTLETAGVTTGVAEDGIAALALLEREKFEAVISDLLMPRMDGYTRCREIRRDPRLHLLPFIAHTGTYLSKADEQLALLSGADRFLRKPAPGDLLLRTLAELLEPGAARCAAAAPPDDPRLIREYNAALVRKLEEKSAELEQRNRELRENEMRLTEAQRVARIGSWHYRPAGTLIWSDEMYEITKLPRAIALTLEAARSVLHPDDRTWSRGGAFECALESGALDFESEYRVVWPEGQVRSVHSLGKIHRDPNGKVIEATGTVQDITERTQTEVELRTAERQLRALVHQLHTVRDEEAKRISRELHDDLGQHLTVLNMELAELEQKLPAATPNQRDQIARMHAVVDHTIEVVQKIAGELRLGQPDVLGLTAAIDWTLQEFSRRSAIPCRFTRADEITNMSDARSTAVVRILQEALTNVVRHAGATMVEISLQAGSDRATLTVRDNGRGITEAELTGPKAIGLLGMHERAQLVGGDVRITGDAGAGTTVLVSMPLNRTGAISA